MGCRPRLLFVSPVCNCLPPFYVFNLAALLMAALSGPYLRFSSSLLAPCHCSLVSALCSVVAIGIWLTLGLVTCLVAGTQYLSKPTLGSGIYFGLLFERLSLWGSHGNRSMKELATLHIQAVKRERWMPMQFQSLSCPSLFLLYLFFFPPFFLPFLPLPLILALSPGMVTHPYWGRVFPSWLNLCGNSVTCLDVYCLHDFKFHRDDNINHQNLYTVYSFRNVL